MKQHIRIKNHKKTERKYTQVTNVVEMLDVMRGHGDRTLYLWNVKKPWYFPNSLNWKNRIL